MGRTDFEGLGVRFEFFLEALKQLFEQEGVVLVDSPGLNDGERNLDDIVRKYTPKAITIICIINCDGGVTESVRTNKTLL